MSRSWSTEGKPKMASRSQFPFLSLPPELRNQIYILVLDAQHLSICYHRAGTGGAGGDRGAGLGKAVVVRRRHARDIYHASDVNLNSALVVANRQIHQETFWMLYSQPLHFQDVAALHSFLVVIGPARREMLTDITLHSWTFGYPLNRPCLELLARSTKLRRIRVQCDDCTGPGLVAVCSSQSACWDFGKCIDEVGLGERCVDSDFVMERSEDGRGFCYSRTWVLAK